MKKRIFFLAISSLMSATLVFSANTTQTVAQVSTAVTLNNDVDYHITGTTPFTATGSINITNTDNAVVILDNIKPSSATAQLGFININGVAATNGTNCVIKIYGHGSIIMPHGSNMQPLTVYSEKNFSGTAYSNYNVGTTYSLTSANMNNRIRSFKLKRGYMVCFASDASGYGYNRIFIADKADRTVSVMQNELYDDISFIKIFQWNDVAKKGYAGNDGNVNGLLNTTWCYNWDAGTNSWADREYVTQHHHEGWPSISDVGKNGSSPNILGNNEPDNNNDSKEHPATVSEVLANWPAMMATGKRLGSPAVSGNLSGWLYPFIDSIDAKGWRCDFIAVHAYWYSDVSSWLSTLSYIASRTKRPIWITEMNYGANWTGWPGDSTTASSANYQIEYNHMKPIIDGLNSASYVERYAIYNWVQECRYVYNSGDASLSSTKYLTPTGVYYANSDPGLAYQSTTEVVPMTPSNFISPSNLSLVFKPASGITTLTWKDPNGGYSDSIAIERKFGLKGTYEYVGSVVPSATNPSYTFKDTIAASAGTYVYRVHIITPTKVDVYSNEAYNVITGAEGTSDVQFGTISATSTTDSYNYFASPFDNMPAIVFGSVTNNNGALAPVEHVYTSYKSGGKYAYFRFNYFPWTLSGYKNFYKTTPDFSSFIVAKTGNGHIGTLPYEAGYVHQNSDADSILVAKDTVYCAFRQAFEEGTVPVVFATPRYTSTTYPYMWRVWDVTNKGFKVILQRQAGLTYAGWPGQYIAYFAIAKGQGNNGAGNIFTVKDNDIKFTSPTLCIKQIDFGQTLTNPKFLAQMQTFNRKCAGILRTSASGPTETYDRLRLQLDSTDTENNEMDYSTKAVTENIGWIVISTDTTYVPDGIDPISVNTSNGNVAVYPSVATEAISVKDMQATKAYIYNVNGLMAKQAQLSEGQATIDVNNIPSGIYIIKTNANHTTRFIKR